MTAAKRRRQAEPPTPRQLIFLCAFFFALGAIQVTLIGIVGGSMFNLIVAIAWLILAIVYLAVAIARIRRRQADRGADTTDAKS